MCCLLVCTRTCVSLCARRGVKQQKHTAQRTPSDACSTLTPLPHLSASPPCLTPTTHTQRADQDSVPHLRSPRRRAHVCFSSLPRRSEAALTAEAATAPDNTSRLQADARQHRRALCSLGGSRSQAPPPNRSFLVPASPGEAM